jgi:hypothetical protein
VGLGRVCHTEPYRGLDCRLRRIDDMTGRHSKDRRKGMKPVGSRAEDRPLPTLR